MPLLDIAPTDLVDIAVVGLLLWGLVAWTRRVHARMALIGLAFWGGFYLLARQFELQLMAWIFQGFFAVLVVLLVVVFQDDLRRLFEQIAALGLRRKASRPGSGSLAVLIRGMHQLAEKRRGALVVLPGREPVERHLQGGVFLDAAISEELFDSQPQSYRDSVLPEAAKFDMMVVTTGTRRVWPVTGVGPLTDEYSLTSDWDNQWLTGGTEDDVIKEAHLDKDSIFNAVKRFADEHDARMSRQAAAFNGASS